MKSTNLSNAMAGTAITSVIIMVLTFFSGVVIARFLSVEDRGIYGALVLIAQMASSLLMFSFLDGVTYQIRQQKKSVYEMTPTILIGGLLMLLPVITFMVGFVALGGMDKYTQSPIVLIFACLVLPAALSCLQIALCLDRANVNFKWVNVNRLVSIGLFTVLCVTLFFFQSYVSIVIIITFLALSRLPIFVIRAWHYARVKPWRLDIKFWKSSTWSGLVFHTAFTLNTLSTVFDRLLIIMLWSATQTGYYFVAFSAVGAGIAVVTQALSVVILPVLSGMSAANRHKTISRLIRISIIMAVCIIIGGYIVIPWLLPLLYGQPYRPAVPMAIYLTVALSISPLRTLILEATRSTGKGRPGTEMAIATLAVMGLGYGLTRYATPRDLALFIGSSNIVAIFIGGLHLRRSGDVKLNMSLIPGPKDIKFIALKFLSYIGPARRKLGL